MILSAKQAADKLNTSRHVIDTLTRYNLIRDLKPVNSNHKKHFAQYDSSELMHFKKFFKTLNSKKVTEASAKKLAAMIASNSSPVAVPISKATLPTKEAKEKAIKQIGIFSSVDAIQRRIDAINEKIDRNFKSIEDKLDSLVKIWS